jgi:hypothetical protein
MQRRHAIVDKSEFKPTQSPSVAGIRTRAYQRRLPGYFAPVRISADLFTQDRAAAPARQDINANKTPMPTATNISSNDM